MRKTILVDARHILPDRMDGIGYFTQEICRCLPLVRPDWQWIFVHDRKIDWPFDLSDNVHTVIWSPPARLPILWKFWYFIGIPFLLKKYKADGFLGTMGWIPLKQTAVQCISVVHDINFYHEPSNLHPWHRSFYAKYFPQFLSAADGLGFVSRFTQNDVYKAFPKISDKPHALCYNAVSHVFFPLDDRAKINARKQFSDGVPYWVFIGTMIPRKNILNHIRAFELYREQNGTRLKFLLMGKYDAMKTEIEERIAQSPCKEDIVLLGRVDEQTKHAVLASAFALLFIPYFEGFGIPILEAMSCGVPVVASETTALPEIGGNACLYADPSSPRQVAQQMRLLDNENTRTAFTTLGIARSKEFSWKNSAEQLATLLD